MSQLPIKRFEVPQSLVNPTNSTAAAKRIIPRDPTSAGVAADMAAPTTIADVANAGDCTPFTEVTVRVKFAGAGFTANVELYRWDEDSATWCKDSDFGTIAMTTVIGVLERTVRVNSAHALFVRISAGANYGTAQVWMKGDK